MTILYIGNSPASYEHCTARTDISLITVSNSIEAIRRLNINNDINVIICQYNLPGNTGLFLFDKIREDPRLNETPFILVSEEFNKNIFNTAFKKGVTDYFVSSTVEPENILAKAISIINFKDIKYIDVDSNIVSQGYKLPRSKRVFDITFASLVLLLVSPLLLITIIAIRLESKGKVYYIAKRVGRNTFNFYKLRSMQRFIQAMHPTTTKTKFAIRLKIE